MTWLAFASMLLGLACVPLLDPVSSRYLRAVGRARRVRGLREPRELGCAGLLVSIEVGIKNAISERDRFVRAGFLNLVPEQERIIRRLRRRRSRTEGYRPSPSALPKSRPPGPSPIPRRPFGDCESLPIWVERPDGTRGPPPPPQTQPDQRFE